MGVLWPTFATGAWAQNRRKSGLLGFKANDGAGVTLTATLFLFTWYRLKFQTLTGNLPYPAKRPMRNSFILDKMRGINESFE